MVLQSRAQEDVALKELRRRVRRLDESLISLAAERTRVCRRLGDIKRRIGAPVRNRAVEKTVLAGARETALDVALDPDFAESMMRMLIEHSVAVQLRDRHDDVLAEMPAALAAGADS